MESCLWLINIRILLDKHLTLVLVRKHSLTLSGLQCSGQHTAYSILTHHIMTQAQKCMPTCAELEMYALADHEMKLPYDHFDSCSGGLYEKNSPGQDEARGQSQPS